MMTTTFKRQSQAAVTISAFCLFGAAFVSPSVNADGLTAYRGRNRVLLVFAPTRTDALYQRQIALLRGAADGMTDRDLILRYEGSDAAAERRQFHVTRNQFRVILLGKDGHAATSVAHPLSARALFGLIDTMPMRRDEMHRRPLHHP